MLTPYTKASLPTPGHAGRLVVVEDDSVWADTGVEWREATEEEIAAARSVFATEKREWSWLWNLLR